MSTRSVFFRAGTGAVIVDAKGRVLACERGNIPGAWQMPQGGMDEDETPLACVLREIQEETGIEREHLELLHACDEPLAYELPPQYRTRKTGIGQVQYWFLFRLKAGDEVIDLGRNGEFRAWRWMEFADLLDAAIPFRQPLYRRVWECVRTHV